MLFCTQTLISGWIQVTFGCSREGGTSNLHLHMLYSLVDPTTLRVAPRWRVARGLWVGSAPSRLLGLSIALGGVPL